MWLQRYLLGVDMSKGAIEIPLSAIVFIIILVIVFALILIWQLGGFDMFKQTIGNVTCGTLGNASQGAVKKC